MMARKTVGILTRPSQSLLDDLDLFAGERHGGSALAFFAFGPSPYGAAWRVLMGLGALGAAVAAVATFARLRRTIRGGS
jgi:hypothetical protein